MSEEVWQSGSSEARKFRRLEVCHFHLKGALMSNSPKSRLVIPSVPAPHHLGLQSYKPPGTFVLLFECSECCVSVLRVLCECSVSALCVLCECSENSPECLDSNFPNCLKSESL